MSDLFMQNLLLVKRNPLLVKWNLLLGLSLLLLNACSGDGANTAIQTSTPIEQSPSKNPPAYVEIALQGAARQNDTGVQFSGNHPRTLNANCQSGVIDPADEWLMGEVFETLTFTGQDCESGRDAHTADPSDGHAGFSFAKIAADGTELPADATEWSCVLDKVTGLLWEAKIPSDGIKGNAGLHDADDVFTWYNTDTTVNGGNIGNWNRDAADCAGYTEGSPESFCNTQAFATRVAAKGLCSFSDWRLPTLRELTSIVNFGRDQPALDLAYFPNLVSWDYWSSHPAVEFPEHARLMNFRLGLAGIGMRMDRNHVLLVRGSSL